MVIEGSSRMGYIISLGTVKNYMRALGLKSNFRVKRKKYSVVANDRRMLVDARHNSEERHKIIATDITEFYSKEVKVYLSVTMDLFNEEILDYEFEKHKGSSLVIPNLKRTLDSIKDTKNVIIHSDNGSEYTSYECQDLQWRYCHQHSFSRKGNCQDNGKIEYLFSILKEESLKDYYYKPFNEIKKYIEFMVYDYNNIRFIGNLQNKTPHEYAVSTP